MVKEGAAATGASTALQEAVDQGAREAEPAEVARADAQLEALLERVEVPPSAPAREAAAAHEPGAAVDLAGVAMRTAVPLAVGGRVVTLRVRGLPAAIEGRLADGVSPELVRRAVKSGDAVVLECAPGEAPAVVGVLQRRLPDELVLAAKRVRIEGEQEVLLRSGRGAMRLRQDGDIELVGGRIAAMSRGLFRLVGRVLRLN